MSESLDLPLQIRKFNPGTFQSDEEVIRQFVVRKPKLGIVMDILRGNVDSASCQHVLVVAPRGRGKSMLLARVAAEIRSDLELAERLLPLRFMEESQEIFNLADFWMESLFYLARESKGYSAELARELQDTHRDLVAEWRGEDLEARARATVLEAADRLGRKLVLMVENLQALCGHVDDDFGWKLRGALQSEPEIILLATATSRFKGLDDAREPFFELFRIIRLEPLETEECRRLWQMVSGDAVSERGIRPLQILTGGSPRLLVIIGEFARHRSLRQLMEELVRLIDDHTEYFRGHLEVFAKTERRVYLAVIDLWRPSTTGEIAARARMDVRAVSALLGRLVERGAVLVEGAGRKRMYAAAERLYSIYYKLRRERDEAAVVRNLIHFMAVFYNETELDEWSRTLTLEAAQWPVLREGIKRAITESPQVGWIFSTDEWRGIEQESGHAEALDFEQADQLWNEIEAAYEGGRFKMAIESADRFLSSLRADSLHTPEWVVARFLNAKAFALEKLSDYVAAIATLDEVIAHFGTSGAPETRLQVAIALANKGVTLNQHGETERSIATVNEVIQRFGDSNIPDLQPSLAMALLCKGTAQGSLGETRAEMATYDEVLDRFGKSDALALQTAVAIALTNKSVTHGQLGEVHAAISTCDEMVARFKDNDTPGIRIQVTIALWVKTKSLLARQDPLAALGSFRSMYAAFVPGHEILTRQLASSVPDLIEAGISTHELLEVLDSDGKKSDAIAPVVVALRQRVGETVRAPAEVLEVASDIRKLIEAKLGAGDTTTSGTPSA